jgi:microcin C transport system substrate-binding protein
MRIIRPGWFIAIAGLGLLALTGSAWADEPATQTVRTAHGFTLFGELKYGAGTSHFEYVNTDAPKGGTYVYGWSSSFVSH